MLRIKINISNLILLEKEHKQMEKEEKIVVTFYTTTDAMLVELEGKQCGILGRLIPTPTQITAQCGLSYMASMSEKEKVLQLLEKMPSISYKLYEIFL